MKPVRKLVCLAVPLLFVAGALGQPNLKHFEKDGLSFDYPASWQISDQSSGQMQYIQMARDGFAEIRIRAPREWLSTPEKEAAAKKLIQDQYVDSFVSQVEQAGMHPKRSVATSQISGADAEGARVRAVMDGEPGVAGDHHDAFADAFVIARDRHRGESQVGVVQGARDRVLRLALDVVDTIDRIGARPLHDRVDEVCGTDHPHPQPFDIDHAGHGPDRFCRLL